MKSILIFISCLYFVFLSCRKDSIKLNFNGLINDTSLNETLEGASVKLEERPAGSGHWESNGTKTTKADGQYAFQIERKKSESYKFTVSKNNYFTIEKTLPSSEISVENDNVINHKLYAYSWIKLRFSNGDSDPNKQIKIIQQKGINGCEGCFPETAIILTGQMDTSLIFLNHGNSQFEYFYEVQGTTNIGTRNVITTAFDTTEILLDY